MSHCLILQQYDDFYIGADSAGSIKINGSFYRTSNSMQKIFSIGTDIYFCSGISDNVLICDRWVHENNKNFINIDALSFFLKDNFSTKTTEDCFDIEFLICRIEDGVSKIYHLAQYNDFNIVVYDGRKNCINIICGGCKTKEGFHIAKESIGNGDVISIYSNVFKQLSDERIGGTLSIYHNNKFFYSMIIDNRYTKTHLLLSDCVIGGYIEGSTLKGGTLEIGGSGGTFKVNSDGSVEILGADGSSTYATKSDFQQVVGWTVEIISDGPTIFTDKSQTTTLTCKVYNQGEDKTNTISSSKFKWIRTSSDTSSDNAWNSKHIGTKTIAITHSDIENNATICCKVDIETT